MNMQEIRLIAKNHGVKSARLSKLNLIHAIQRIEDNFDCFASASEGCSDQAGCSWRTDCFAAARKPKQ